MMHFNLTDPCFNCPFRTDIPFYLGEKRAKEIANAIVDRQQTFSCHQTLDYEGEAPRQTERTQHCAGAMILLEKINKPNQMMRIAERLRFYQKSRLNVNAPVYDSIEEFIEGTSNPDKKNI